MQTSQVENEEKLKDGISQGCHKSFELLFHQHKDFLFHYAFRILKSKEAADEMVQKTFIRLWQGKARISSVVSLKGYLFAIARNLILDHLKKVSREQVLKDDLKLRIQISHIKPETDLIYSDLKAIASQAIESLPTQRKLIFKLNRENGFSYHEIASQLNISENTVKVSIYKSLNHIRHYLSRHTDLSFALIFWMELFFTFAK